MEWLLGESNAAVQVILKVAGVEGTSSVVVLRAKRNLMDSFDMTPEELWKEREAWVKLRALLELLTSSVVAALAVFDDFTLGTNRPQGVAEESLIVASLLMLYRHAAVLRNPTSLALQRERVEKAMLLYPNNTIVLGLFLHVEKGQGVWGRVRGILGENNATNANLAEKDVARRVAEVWIAGWERGRWEAEVDRTRSGLSAAVQSDRQVHFMQLPSWLG